MYSLQRIIYTKETVHILHLEKELSNYENVREYECIFITNYYPHECMIFWKGEDLIFGYNESFFKNKFSNWTIICKNFFFNKKKTFDDWVPDDGLSNLHHSRICEDRSKLSIKVPFLFFFCLWRNFTGA